MRETPRARAAIQARDSIGKGKAYMASGGRIADWKRLLGSGAIYLGGVIVFLAYAFAQGHGFAYFFRNGGGPMLLPLVGLYSLGHIRSDAPPHRFSLGVAAITIVWMANARGFYWRVFPATDGFWTANRLSAFALFALVYFAPWRMIEARANHRP